MKSKPKRGRPIGRAQSLALNMRIDIGLMPSTARGEEVCSINQERAAKAMEQLELWQRFGGFGDFANLNFKRA